MARTRRKFPANRLVPSGGEIYSHIFDNENIGLARNLFWSVTIDFQPIRYGEEDFSCSLTCEWIAWPLRDWRELDGRQLDVDYKENGVESSFYMTEHDIAHHTKLSLHHRRENVFSVKVDMLVDFHGYYGGDEDPIMEVQAEADVPFIGLLLNPNNLSPKPNDIAEILKVASDFVELSSFKEPEPWGKHGFVFRPVGYVGES